MVKVNRKLQLIILLFLVCLVGTLSIAYAVLSTELIINGQAEVSSASWNISFNNINIFQGSVDAVKEATITSYNEISFSVNLKEPGNFYKFSVDIVNNGTIDAVIDSIIKRPTLTDEESKYLKFDVEYIDGSSINDKKFLNSGEVKKLVISVLYRNDIPISNLPNSNSLFDFEIEVVCLQRDSANAEIPLPVPTIKLVSGNLNTIGSEICVDDQCFYLIENDGEMLTMLAKYNLYVGAMCTSATNCQLYGNEATGLQNADMKGYQGTANRHGVVAFSQTAYWLSDSTQYPLYVFDQNSNLYQYVEFYKNHLKGIGLLLKDVRLITKEELIKLGCSIPYGFCMSSSYGWVYSTSYWSGTALDETHVFYVRSGGSNFDSYAYNAGHGVRPVVEVELSKISFSN